MKAPFFSNNHYLVTTTETFFTKTIDLFEIYLYNFMERSDTKEKESD